MIVLFTDFGADDIYVAQMKAVLQQHLPATISIIDLLHSAPVFNPRASAHLLASFKKQFPLETVFLTVVDPGVGSTRLPIVLKADGRWFIGPDNGLLAVIDARAHETQTWRITWQPETLSASFHGRDLFAPIAAEIAASAFPADKLESALMKVRETGDDLPEIIYIDHYGNAFTGLRAAHVAPDAVIEVNGMTIRHARVFSDAVADKAFWYENSIGLIEIAVNRDHAALRLGLNVGTAITIKPGAS